MARMMYEFMYDVLPSILSFVLTIINYPNNKQKFIVDFQQVCRQYTVLSLVEKLSKDKQEELKGKLKNIISGDVGKQIIFSYFSQEDYRILLDQYAQKLFQDYIADISPKLSSENRQELERFLRAKLSS